MPKEIILIGVEAVVFELGEGLSPAVRAAIPKALRMINQVLRNLTGD
jgi:Ni,Fe-hydrogenase maturation factor